MSAAKKIIAIADGDAPPTETEGTSRAVTAFYALANALRPLVEAPAEQRLEPECPRPETNTIWLALPTAAQRLLSEPAGTKKGRNIVVVNLVPRRVPQWCLAHRLAAVVDSRTFLTWQMNQQDPCEIYGHASVAASIGARCLTGVSALEQTEYTLLDHNTLTSLPDLLSAYLNRYFAVPPPTGP